MLPLCLLLPYVRVSEQVNKFAYISWKLFIIAVEVIFYRAKLTHRHNIEDEILTNLKFVDDLSINKTQSKGKSHANYNERLKSLGV